MHTMNRSSTNTIPIILLTISGRLLLQEERPQGRRQEGPRQQEAVRRQGRLEGLGLQGED